MPIRFRPSGKIPEGAPFAVSIEYAESSKRDRVVGRLARAWNSLEKLAGWNREKRRWEQLEPVAESVEQMVSQMRQEQQKERHYQFLYDLFKGDITSWGRDRRIWREIAGSYTFLAERWPDLQLPRPRKRIHDPSVLITLMKQKGLFS